jgi:hypothetical protein
MQISILICAQIQRILGLLEKMGVGVKVENKMEKKNLVDKFRKLSGIILCVILVRG